MSLIKLAIISDYLEEEWLSVNLSVVDSKELLQKFLILTKS
jgi:hypothetical protein